LSRSREIRSDRISGIPSVKGTQRMFFMRVERCSRRSWNWSASAFFAVLIPPMYFRKSMPHFSQVPPWRCSWLHDGHLNRSVAWQRVQNRAISRTSVPHLGHLTIGRAPVTPSSAAPPGRMGPGLLIEKLYFEWAGKVWDPGNDALSSLTLAARPVKIQREPLRSARSCGRDRVEVTNPAPRLAERAEAEPARAVARGCGLCAVAIESSPPKVRRPRSARVLRQGLRRGRQQAHDVPQPLLSVWFRHADNSA